MLRVLVYSLLLIFFFIPGTLLAEDTAVTSNVSSLTPASTQEALMNLAHRWPRHMLLKTEKPLPYQHFLDKATFVRNGMFHFGV